MPIQISIPDASTRYLNATALNELQARVLSYVNDVVMEAGRLEAGTHSAAGAPEITSSMLADADLLLRRGYRRPRRRRLMTCAKVLSPVGGLLTGLLADFEKLKEPINLVLFVIFLAITIATTVVVALEE
jgi:hypothetical protein